jgi:Tfp pilus assembly protein PilF
MVGLAAALASPSPLWAGEDSSGAGQAAGSYLHRAEAALANKDYDLAVQYATKAVEKKPFLIPAYAARGMAHYFQDRHYLAIQDFCKVLAWCRAASDVYVLRGTCYLKKKMYAEAVADASAAIKVRQRYAAAYFLRAVAYRAQGQNKLAKADYRRWQRYRRSADRKAP